MDFGKRHDPVVYFVRDGGDGSIKIGHTTDLRNRLSCIQTYACEGRAEVLGWLPGGYDREQAIHLQFSADRWVGEWFHPSEALLAFVAAETTPYTPPPGKNHEFRALHKEQISGQIPSELATEFRERVARERSSISEALTLALCQFVRQDPRAYGIEPRPRRRPEPAAR